MKEGFIGIKCNMLGPFCLICVPYGTYRTLKLNERSMNMGRITAIDQLLQNKWTTFLKSRLNCSVPGEYPFYFNEIQSTTQLLPGQYRINVPIKIRTYVIVLGPIFVLVLL